MAMSLDEISAHLEIRQTLARYSRGVDRRDLAMLKSVYHDDATDDHGLFRGTGHDFAEWLLAMHNQFPQIGQHHITQSYIELDGRTAHVESYYLAINPMVDADSGSPYLMPTGGRYLDRFEQRDGAWRIARRVCTIDWSRERLTGDAWDTADIFAAVGPAGRDVSDAYFGDDRATRQSQMAARMLDRA